MIHFPNSHTTFLASRIANIPIGIADGSPPAGDPEFDWDNGDYIATFEWQEVEWSN